MTCRICGHSVAGFKDSDETTCYECEHYPHMRPKTFPVELTLSPLGVVSSRLDAALRRIEALELEVARLKGPALYDPITAPRHPDTDREVGCQARVPPTKLSCGCIVQCGGHETAQLEHGKIVYYAPHSRSQVDMRAEEYGANGAPLPDEGT